MTVFYPVQIKVTEPQIKSISLNLPTKYLRRYAKQYHFILVQIKVTESQIKSISLNLPTRWLQRHVAAPPKIKSQKIKRNFFMFFIKSADKTIFLWYNYTNLKFYSEREMCYIYDL